MLLLLMGKCVFAYLVDVVSVVGGIASRECSGAGGWRMVTWARARLAVAIVAVLGTRSVAMRSPLR